jgi:transcriptional regulator with XRE-family HTH domain
MVCHMAVTSTGERSNRSVTLALRADWIRDRAKRLGYERIEDLADAAGISRQHLHRLLNGGSLPGAGTAHALAAALHCMVDDLYETPAAA